MSSPFDVLDQKYPDIRFELYPNDKAKRVYLTGFIVPYTMRGQGVGSSFMEDLTKIADDNGWTITLTPSSSYGGNVTRLRSFYKGFGFIENKGQNRDFSHREDMYRSPRGLNENNIFINNMDELNLNRLVEVMGLINDDLVVESFDVINEEKEKADRCLRIARRKYDKPSAYRSGAIVQCRRGKIWKDLKEEDINDAPDDVKELIYKAHDAITRRKGKDYAPDVHELQAWVDEYLDGQQNEEISTARQQFQTDLLDDPDYIEFKDNAKNHYGTPHALKNDPFIQKKKWSRVGKEDPNYDPDFDDDIDEAKKTDYSKEKKSGLHGWFSRRGGGGSKGWVDCNTCRKTDGKKKCKACGRQAGEERSKYPSCRPTPASCGTPGKGKKWGKTKEESYDIMNEAEGKEKKRIALLFIVINNKVLLFKRSPEETTNPGKYGMLGGHIEKGESPEEALRREIKEEAGVELGSFKKLKTYELDDVQLNVFYTNEFDTENIKLDKKEHTGKKFFTLEQLDEMSPEECIDTNKGIARDYNKKAKEDMQLNETIQRMKSIISL
jgi:8-oxo-dGTP pyrophosphatase MutT (NUDIX family)